MRSLSFGKPSITARGKRVRSRIITTMSKSLRSPMVSASLRRTASVNTLISTSFRHLRPVGELERHVLVVVDDRAAIGHVSTLLCTSFGRTLEHDPTWEPVFGYRAAPR
jgi:hypothetical protein